MLFVVQEESLLQKLRTNKLEIGTFHVSLPPFFPTPLPPSPPPFFSLPPPQASVHFVSPPVSG